MPRHDWDDDDTMSRDRDRDRWEMRDRERGDDRFRDREDSAFFEDRANRHSHDDRYAIGGWGDRDEMRDRDRERDREHMREQDRERMRRREQSRDRDQRRFGSDDHNRGVPMDETQRLIASNKVEGTPVYDRHGDRLGSVHNFMVDKRQGKVVYAVLKHGGGFLGLSERYYPLEWDQLTYDTRLEGYATDLIEDDLKNFGSFDADGRYHRRRMSQSRRRERERSDW